MKTTKTILFLDITALIFSLAVFIVAFNSGDYLPAIIAVIAIFIFLRSSYKGYKEYRKKVKNCTAPKDRREKCELENCYKCMYNLNK